MARDFEPGPLAEVACETGAGDRPTLVFVRELRHPPERVWVALTEPAQHPGEPVTSAAVGRPAVVAVRPTGVCVD
ncbi:MAG TPA: hypothetical protein VIL37_09355 [Natronosporangium sp.]